MATKDKNLFIETAQAEPEVGQALDLIMRKNTYGYLSEALTLRLYEMMSSDVRTQVDGVYKMRDCEANRLITKILLDEGNVEKFLDNQKFYADFLLRCGQLGLSNGFDRNDISLSIEVPKSSATKVNKRLACSMLLEEQLGGLKLPEVFSRYETVLVEEAFGKDLSKIRDNLLSEKRLTNDLVKDIGKYYQTLRKMVCYRYRAKVADLSAAFKEGQFLKVASGINEMLRDKMGNEVIALETDYRIKTGLESFLEIELREINAILGGVDWESLEKTDETAAPVVMEKFELKMDRRDADSLARGVISSDCTDIRRDFAFHETVPQHLLDPGFMNMRLLHEGKWVGNNYMLAMEHENAPVLVIDAVQTSEEYNFPCHTVDLAEQVLSGISQYAEQAGFKAMYLSRFVSNRGILNQQLAKKYDLDVVRVGKIGGFEHLKALGLWNENAFRNEYLETLMAGKPNLVSQDLPLRLLKKL